VNFSSLCWLNEINIKGFAVKSLFHLLLIISDIKKRNIPVSRKFLANRIVRDEVELSWCGDIP
jgi:hypothetical protein